MKKVAVLHSDFGIGGAERLMLDICLGLIKNNYDVHIFTNQFDKNRCFEEFKENKFNIKTFLNLCPLSIFGKFYALIAIIKMFLLACFLILKSNFKREYDFIITDGVGYITIPLLKFFGYKVFFYCHYPDQLLCNNKCIISKFYRYPINYIEEICTKQSDIIAVNSEFTKNVVLNCFKSINHKFKKNSDFLYVFYPCVNEKKFDLNISLSDIKIIEDLKNIKHLFLSINRFERKKNLVLALKSFKILKDLCKKNNYDNFNNFKLVIMGGYDERVKENIDYEIELKILASLFEINNQVIFLKSPTDETKRHLLSIATATLYTPSHEHFGIVPIEAMAAKCPVIAVNSGGPKETIINNETGFLCNSNALDFANAMFKLVQSPQLVKEIGNKGVLRIKENFSVDIFNTKLIEIIKNLKN